jgi:AraC family transcriptional regulator
MHVAAPVQSTCRCDGRLLPRIQRQGDLDVMPPASFASWHDEAPSTILAMRIEPWLLASVEEDIAAKHHDPQPQLHLRDARIEHIGWALQAELQAEQPVGRLYAESLGVALCTQLLRLYGNTEWLHLPISVPKRRVTRAIDYIQEHLHEDLSLMALASISGLSPSHFKVVFKESTGVPVHQYVLRARVESAVSLISAGDLSLRDIAVQTGFSDQSHMARCVRRMTGKTPRALRP